MKLKIKNPLLRWLAGCGVLTGTIGAVGVILWLMGWLARFIPNYDEWHSKTILDAPVPLDFVLLGFLIAIGLVLATMLLIALFYIVKTMGNRYFNH